MSIPPNKKQKLDVEHLVENILNETRPGHFSMDNTPINLEDLTVYAAKKEYEEALETYLKSKTTNELLLATL